MIATSQERIAMDDNVFLCGYTGTKPQSITTTGNSYGVGFEAFIKRFQKRFSESDGFVFVKKTNRDSVSYKITLGGRLIAEIVANLSYGISFSVRSNFLNSNNIDKMKWFVVYRQPLHPYIFGNQFSRRNKLQNKPKFAQLGSKLSMQIRHNFFKYVNSNNVL